MDDKWSEHFAWLESMFLARSFQVPVEPVQKSDAVVTDRPFISTTQQPTGVTGLKQSSGTANQRELKKATQPVEAPGAVLATRSVEAPSASSVTLFTSRKSSLPADVDRPEVQLPGPAAQPATFIKKNATSLSGSVAPVDEPAPESEQFSDRASSYADEGKVSDQESTSPDQEELSDADQELIAEQTYRKTFHGVRSLMAWNDIPEFEPSSSSQADNPFTGSRSSHTG